MPSILTLTVNPALDISTSVDSVEPDHKLRCATPRFDAGGGGVNVSRAIRHLGGDSLALVSVGGGIGQFYSELLQQTGIRSELFSLTGQTRVSLAVTERNSDHQFRFTLPGPDDNHEMSARLLAHLDSVLDGEFRYIVASGSLSPGMPSDFYAQLCELARAHGTRMILDTSGDALRQGLAARPHILRIDHFEARELVEGNTLATASPTDVARAVVAEGLAEIAIITVDAEGAIVASSDLCAHIRPPKVDVVSAVGAGDSFVAGLVMGLERGDGLVDACRLAVAAAASAVTTPATELCTKEGTETLFVACSVHMDDDAAH